MDFLSRLPDGRSLLAVYVQPRSSRTGLIGIHDQALKVALTAPPVDDAANKALIIFFSSFFKIPRKQVILHKGQQSRRKQVIIEGLSSEAIMALIKTEIHQPVSHSTRSAPPKT
jgi:uncharacterized protein (TIGR00251 family)